jgi:hypothetical protein
MVNTAIFDAVNGILKDYTPYHVTASAPPGASPEAAAAVAAHDVLASLFPAQSATFDAGLADSLAGVPDGQAKTDGMDWGGFCAESILLLRASDGSDAVDPYTPPTGIGWWVPTLPSFSPAVSPNWPGVSPWTMMTASQFRGDGPPAIGSAEYAADYNEMMELGRIDSTTRTADQTEIALFWQDGAGTHSTPGHWIHIAQIVAAQRRNSLSQNARLFALVSLGVADAAIVAWDNKYAYNLWRPITAIQQGDADGNAGTAGDATWLPLLDTPPFPEYTSGHSTFGGASAELLALFFGTDHIPFDDPSDSLVGVTRHYNSFSQATAENGRSRIYAGIHWEFSDQDGERAGRTLGRYIFWHFLRPTFGVKGAVESGLR